MSYACVCDGESPDIYCADRRKARKEYRCYECTGHIKPGDMYENARSFYEGSWDHPYRTCARCLDVRDYVKAHAPCFCWLHGSVLDDAKSTVEEYGHISAGFYIGAMKRILRARHIE